MFAFQTLSEQVLDQLLKLDDWNLPGLTASQFAQLFTKCRRCGLVTTARVHSRHACKATAGVIVIDLTAVDEVIDLTNDGDDQVIDLTNDDVDCPPGVIDLTLDE